MDLMLQGKVALITGGSSGLGCAIGVKLAEAGCDVTCTGLDEGEVKRVRERWPSIRAQMMDVTDHESIDRVTQAFERLDILVNCAGTISRNLQEFDPVEFARVVDVNLNGTMRVSQSCHPLLATSHGCIVNMASMLSFFGSGFVPAYSSSKGGITQLTKSLAIAWAADQIRVNAVAPGWIKTQLTQPLYDDKLRDQQIIERTPLGRWGEPDDVTGAVLFLCSASARFITGAVLPVDGGYSIT